MWLNQLLNLEMIKMKNKILCKNYLGGGIVNSKIIGFTVSNKEISHHDIDLFDVGFNIKKINHQELVLYLWGIGDIEDYITKTGEYSLSFPINNSLKDRNILITLDDKGISVENDWLASIPVFYNNKKVIASTLINKVVENANIKDIHPEGFNNYLEFGYSVLEQTPFNNIKFMRYSSELKVTNEKINIFYKEDPVEKFNKKFSEQEILEKIRNYIKNGEEIVEGDIIIPTSGGYDSRLLNLFIEDKSRIKSFTYGISPDQSKSSEVVRAKKISELLGTDWKQIKLGEFNKYINEWFELFGCSTHLHGMYHIEFYSKMPKFDNVTFLSGIVGDAWAGDIEKKEISLYEDLVKLGYTHGLNADKDKSVFKNINKIKKTFFKDNKTKLNNYINQIVFLIRLKIILLSYLQIIPEYFGMPVWSPYLNMDIALGMLNLPQERRKNRKWQSEFFKKKGLDLENMNLNHSKKNNLELQGLKNSTLEKLDIDLLSEIISTDYLNWINENLFNDSMVRKYKRKLLSIPKVGGVLRRMGAKNKKLKALSAYKTIKSVELMVKKNER